jgi:hypothetical protein
MGGKPEPPFDVETEKLKDMEQVVWSAIGDKGSRRNDKETDLEEVLRQAEKYSNVTGAVLDDFFIDPEENEGEISRYSLAGLAEMRDKLHNCRARALDFWLVWYKSQLDYPVEDYLAVFDVISYWNMKTQMEFAELEDDFAKVVSKTPGKRRMLGCYLWDYFNCVPLTIPEIQKQCESFYSWIKAGKADGVIFCSNCCVDLGGAAVDWVRDWIKEAGDELV